MFNEAESNGTATSDNQEAPRAPHRYHMTLEVGMNVIARPIEMMVKSLVGRDGILAKPVKPVYTESKSKTLKRSIDTILHDNNRVLLSLNKSLLVIFGHLCLAFGKIKNEVESERRNS